MRCCPAGRQEGTCSCTQLDPWSQVGEHGYGELAGSGLGFSVVELNAASVRAWRLVQVRLSEECGCWGSEAGVGGGGGG